MFKLIKNIFKYLFKKVKFFIGLFLVILILVFVGLYIYESYQHNKKLETRLNQLENVSDSLYLPPSQHYANARQNIRDGKYETALNTLNSIKLRYPEWNSALVNKTIRVTNNIIRDVQAGETLLDNNQNDIVDNSNNVSDLTLDYETREITPITNIPKAVSKPKEERESVSFKHFVYEDRNNKPLKAATSGGQSDPSSNKSIEVIDNTIEDIKTKEKYWEKRRNESGKIKTNLIDKSLQSNSNKNVAVDARFYESDNSQDFGFTDFQFEDKRYKNLHAPSSEAEGSIESIKRKEEYWEKRRTVHKKDNRTFIDTTRFYYKTLTNQP